MLQAVSRRKRDMNMWRKLIILCVIYIFSGSNECLPETVTRKEALNVAKKFFESANKKNLAAPRLIYDGRKLTTDRLFSPFYVYNHSDGGFVIVPADNKAFPVLAYDLKNKFDPGNLDEDVKKKLSQYAKEIELIRYDPRIPYEAEDAWRDVSGYVKTIVGGEAKYEDGCYMVSATEYFNDLPAETCSEYKEEEPDDEYVPFFFYGQFMEEMRAAEEERSRLLDNVLIPESPVLKSLGGGHFEVRLPEPVSMARIYNLQGAQVERLVFRNTDTAFIRLDGMPNGFYFLLINGESGKPYGMKLFK